VQGQDKLARMRGFQLATATAAVVTADVVDGRRRSAGGTLQPEITLVVVTWKVLAARTLAAAPMDEPGQRASDLRLTQASLVGHVRVRSHEGTGAVITREERPVEQDQRGRVPRKVGQVLKQTAMESDESWKYVAIAALGAHDGNRQPTRPTGGSIIAGEPVWLSTVRSMMGSKRMSL
jgi:hypothetical protein